MFFFLGITPAKKSKQMDTQPGAGPSSQAQPVTPRSSRPCPNFKSILDTPFNRYLKLDIRSKAQLKFDLEVTKFLVQANLPFNLVSTQAFKNFIASLDRKFHIKNPTTFSKAKLPLLYKQIKDAVTLKMKKELPGTVGIAFTSDMWISR